VGLGRQSLDKSGFAQTAPECRHPARIRRRTVEESDNRHRRLLCASGQRHRDDATRNAADERSTIRHFIPS